jgi:hypothetical protein
MGGGPGAREPDGGAAGAGGRNGHVHGRRGDVPGSGEPERPGHPVIAYLRANPQALVLLVICLVLGLGTFLAVVVALLTAGSDQTTGEPSGIIFAAHAARAAHAAVATLHAAISGA